ncbi:hypothetical protein GCM10022268_33610 [Sphingomonas cynarae]|uniref:Uncharacterized protein n=1 Tax=Sphingomonas cynarae TaxID=930197 RepID=A0ABP7ET41_9SPHN
MTNATSNGRNLRIAVAVLAIVLVAITTLYIVDVSRLILVRMDGDRNLLETGAIPTGKPDKAHKDAIATALAINPLSQSALNALLVERARDAGRPMAKDEADLLLRLGWRDEASLRNVGEVYADGSDLSKLLNVFDALLRRSTRSGEPVTNVLTFMETQPALQAALVNKLSQDPPWRSLFLRLTTSQLNTRQAALDRLQTYQALARTKRPPTEVETAAVLPALYAQGFGGEAFELWQDVRRRGDQPLLMRPLADPDFMRAARLQEDQEVMTVYDWTIEHGDGFGIRFGSDAKGVVIEWDGRGIPVFARQRSSALPGAYRLAVITEAEAEGEDTIGYRLVCPEGVVELRPAAMSGRTRLYRADERVGCEFPIFEIFGRPQNRPRDVRATLNRVTLSPD